MNARVLEAHAKQRLGIEFPPDDRERRVLVRAGVLPRQLRVLARDDDRRRAVRPRDAGALRRHCCRNGRAVNGGRPCTCRVMRPRCRSAPKRWRRRLPPKPPARQLDVRVVRNGSRGMCWLEPLVEVADTRRAHRLRPGRRRATSPGLFDAGFLHGGAHALAPRSSRRHPVLQSQERLTFARVGRHGSAEPRRLPGATAATGLRRALAMAPADDRAGGHRFGSARPWRRGVPDRHQMEDGARRSRPIRSTSPAMPTKGIRARSPIAC